MSMFGPKQVDAEVLSPRPIIIRRAGGALGLDPALHCTAKGDYIFVSGADGVASSSRVALGTVPVELVATAAPAPPPHAFGLPLHFHDGGEENSLAGAFSNLEPLSAHRRRAANQFGGGGGCEHARPRSASPSAPRNYAMPSAPHAEDEMLENFAGGKNLPAPLESARRQRQLDGEREAKLQRAQALFESHVLRAPAAAAIVTPRGVVRRMNEGLTPTPPPPAHPQQNQRPMSGVFVRQSSTTPRKPAVPVQSPVGNSGANRPRSTTPVGARQQQQQQRHVTAAAVAAAAAAAAVASSAGGGRRSTSPRSCSPRKAVATPGTLRIMQGQLQNGIRLQKVVAMTTQLARDRIYRPRNDDEREKHFASMFPHREHIESDRQPARSGHTAKADERARENLYSPSRRRAGVPTAATLLAAEAMMATSSTCVAGSKSARVHGGGRGSTRNNTNDFFSAVEFDPYALSLLSTLPPLSASADPFMNSRAELRRQHAIDPSPGALVMYTALGHLRAVGAAPYLLDVQFGVAAVRPKFTEEEKMRQAEDATYAALSSEDDADDDDADDTKAGAAEAGDRGSKNLSVRTKNKLDAYHRSMFGASSSYNNKDNNDSSSPNSTFRRMAEELLAPLPSAAFDEPGSVIEHPQAPHQQQFGSAEALQRAAAHDRNKRMLDQHRREYQRIKAENGGSGAGGSGNGGPAFDPDEKLSVGVTVQIDGRCLSDPQQRVTRPKYRVFCVFCDRHPLPGLSHVCRVQMPKPAPAAWSPQDIVICFGWRADADIDHGIDRVVGDAFFVNTGLKEHAWESTLMERRLVFQFFAPPLESDLTRETGGTARDGAGVTGKALRGRQLGTKGSFHHEHSSSNGNGGGGAASGLHELLEQQRQHGAEFGFERDKGAVGARHRPFRVHDFEMSDAAASGYQVFTWAAFSEEFSRAIGEAFLRGV